MLFQTTIVRCIVRCNVAVVRCNVAVVKLCECCAVNCGLPGVGFGPTWGLAYAGISVRSGDIIVLLALLFVGFQYWIYVAK